ncbi:MAG: helix-turn-helix transcriptional regulator [Thiohalomonadales bacterium]
MAKVRTYSKYSVESVSLLAKLIKLGRKQRKWSENELADRAGISRATVQKIEKGDLTCAIGLVFETAMLVGVNLFDVDNTSLTAHLENTNNKIALLPKAIHKSNKEVDDEF